jgi:deoxyribose-phosphate aldolase
MNTDTAQLVERITREVVALLREGEPLPEHGLGLDEGCSDCAGLCVQRCPDSVRRVLEAGASRFAAQAGATTIAPDLAKFIDHTLLKPDATEDQVRQLCLEARQYGFAAVCINPVWVRLATQLLRGTPVKVCAVVGFPLGAIPPEVKAQEARRAIRDGAREIDMVINIGALKAGDHQLVKKDIAKVVDACHESGALCKVIIEAALLTDEEKIMACRLAKEARADYVKTSTGFGPGGATEHDVALMRWVVGPEIGVKAAGGIRTAADALKMIRAGATRIGASAGVKIVQQARSADLRTQEAEETE